MQEVTIRLKFTRECLGSVRRVKMRNGFGKTIFSMPRGPGGRVMFLPTWWSELVKYASELANLGQGLVGKITWDPVVDGYPRPNWRRIVVPARRDRRGRARYCSHEAFGPGDTIGVNAVLPTGLSTEDLFTLLELAGTYKGISPFHRNQELYGTFEVVSIRPAVRSKQRPNTDIVEIDIAATRRRGKRRHARLDKTEGDPN